MSTATTTTAENAGLPAMLDTKDVAEMFKRCNLAVYAEARVVPEKLRTLERGRPWRDSQFASTRLSPSRDMSR